MTNAKVKSNKQKKLNRDEKARRDAKMKEDMQHPVNQFMNYVNDDGKLKYPLAAKLRQYFLANPDPAINAMQMSNALLHEIRWHKQQAKDYYNAHLNKENQPTGMFDKQGKLMSREDCYIAFISETQVIQTVISKLRNHLIQGLLPTIDQDIFTFDQFNDYVLGVEKHIKDMGYTLFPVKVDIIEPL